MPSVKNQRKNGFSCIQFMGIEYFINPDKSFVDSNHQKAMFSIHIKVIEFITVEKWTVINPLILVFNMSNQIRKLKLIKKPEMSNYTCEKPIIYSSSNQKDTVLSIEFKRQKVFKQDEPLGKLVIPLNWFPSNHIVREWFPFRAASGNPNAPTYSKDLSSGYVLLDVHINYRNALPFMAPFAPLRVLPCWEKPKATTYYEMPIHPLKVVNTPEFQNNSSTSLNKEPSSASNQYYEFQQPRYPVNQMPAPAPPEQNVYIDMQNSQAPAREPIFVPNVY